VLLQCVIMCLSFQPGTVTEVGRVIDLCLPSSIHKDGCWVNLLPVVSAVSFTLTRGFNHNYECLKLNFPFVEVFFYPNQRVQVISSLLGLRLCCRWAAAIQESMLHLWSSNSRAAVKQVINFSIDTSVSFVLWRLLSALVLWVLICEVRP